MKLQQSSNLASSLRATGNSVLDSEPIYRDLAIKIAKFNLRVAR